MTEIAESNTLKKASRWGIAFAVLSIVAGFVSLLLPRASSIGITILIGWLLMFSGLFHIVDAFHARGFGQVAWRLLVGLVYIVFGFDLAFVPLRGVITLTLVLGIMLLVLGALGIYGFIRHRRLPGTGWILFNAIISVVLGLIILWDGPSAAGWVIGTLVGIQLIFSGFSSLMIWSALRKSLAGTAV
jgi:uncharacterized membrane protein HdeD (DUF308 family)